MLMGDSDVVLHGSGPGSGVQTPHASTFALELVSYRFIRAITLSPRLDMPARIQTRYAELNERILKVSSLNSKRIPQPVFCRIHIPLLPVDDDDTRFLWNDSVRRALPVQSVSDDEYSAVQAGQCPGK